MPVRLITVDAVTMVRMGYQAAVANYPDIKLIGQAAGATEAADLVAKLRPDAVSVDTQLADGDGLELATSLRAENPRLGVVLTGPAQDELIFQALAAGLSAFIPRTETVESLMSVFRRAAEMPLSFSAPNLAAAMARRKARAAALSPREEQMLSHLHSGMNLAAIAAHLSLTESTVRTHVTRLYSKLGAHTRAEALAVAAMHDMI